jgi:hypothetical protein
MKRAAMILVISYGVACMALVTFGVVAYPRMRP